MRRNAGVVSSRRLRLAGHFVIAVDDHITEVLEQLCCAVSPRVNRNSSGVSSRKLVVACPSGTFR